VDHLGAVLGDAPALVLAADHEAGDVLEEDQRDLAEAAELDEVGRLERRLAEEHAVVGDDPDREAEDAGEAGHDGGRVELLELREAAAVDDPRDHLADVVGDAGVAGDDPVDLLGVVDGLVGGAEGDADGLLAVEGLDDAAGLGEGVAVVERVVVGDPGVAGVDVGAAELLGGHDLAGGGLHERRPPEEDGALPLDDDRLVAHRRDVGAARGARPEDHGDLRDVQGRQPRLVVEDAAEVVAVGEDLVLHRQERAAGVDEVDARQVVLEGDLLGAEVLLHRQREVGPALNRGVVGDDHALGAVDEADAGDDAGGRCLAVVHAVRREPAELEERRARIEQQLDALAREELAELVLTRDPAAAGAGLAGLVTQGAHQHTHRGVVGGELRIGRIDVGREALHGPRVIAGGPVRRNRGPRGAPCDGVPSGCASDHPGRARIGMSQRSMRSAGRLF